MKGIYRLCCLGVLASVGVASLWSLNTDVLAKTISNKEKQAFHRMVEQSPAYDQLANRVVGLIRKNDAKGVLALMSPKQVEAVGQKQVMDYLSKTVMPFFIDYKEPSEQVVIVSVQDADHHKGFAFYKSFKNGKGELKPYLIQVLKVEGKLVVANIMPNQQYRAHKKQKSKKSHSTHDAHHATASTKPHQKDAEHH